ncbi:maleylpyruvate isomerase family mycothiol-dependent enzyme [soil metagenome]
MADQRSLDRDVAGTAAAHQALLADLDAWVEAGAADPTGPSLLPDWSIGHVLTHIARNAESHERMLDGFEQYEDGASGREADIAAGADRSAEALVLDVRRTIWSLESRWARHADWDAVVDRLGGPAPASDLAFRRWRETAVHHVDLGIGYSFADLPADHVRLELRRLEMTWAARRPMGLTTLPEAALQRPPHERLAWLLGRATFDDLPPAAIF